MYHNDKNRQIWSHTACFIEDKMYLMTNQLTGLYSFDGLSGKTKYLKKYIAPEYPEIFPYKVRTMHSYKRMLFLFPFIGNQYEIYDTNKEKKVCSGELSEGYACYDVCDMEDKFCILEYNAESRKALIKFWNKNDYLLSEWEELSNAINQIKSAGEGLSFLKEMISVGELLVIGVGETSEYIMANVATKEIKKYSLKDCDSGIHTISTSNDKVFIVTNDSSIVTLDITTGFDQKKYRGSIDKTVTKPLYTIISMMGNLFALCHYDLTLYRLELNESNGEYMLQRIIEEDGYEYDMFLPKCPYLETLIKGNSLFLLPLDSDEMVEYIFYDDYVKKVVHSIPINKEHLNSYIEGELSKGGYIITESNDIGKDIVSFTNFICDSTEV